MRTSKTRSPLLLLALWASSGMAFAQTPANAPPAQPRESTPPASRGVAENAPRDAPRPAQEEGLAIQPPAASRQNASQAPVPTGVGGIAQPVPASPAPRTQAQRAQRQFDLADTDGDRSLSSAELRGIDDPSADFFALDRNSDGRISNAEWLSRPAGIASDEEDEEE